MPNGDGLEVRPNYGAEPASQIVVSALPILDHLQQPLFLFEFGPDRLPGIQCHFVQTFALAFRVATVMRRGRNPQYAVQRNVLVIDAAKDTHDGSLTTDWRTCVQAEFMPPSATLSLA